MSNHRPFLLDLDQTELGETLASWGLPPYRVNQMWEGLYRHFWQAADDFTPLPQKLRKRLAAHYDFSHGQPVRAINSRDGFTQKILFRLPDGELIEAVLMRYARRRTLCISTQAGCAMGCVFCATGQMGFRRNLSSGEIIEQVLVFARQLLAEGQRPTNIVLMGMGEPFHNYEATLAAINRLNNPQGFNFGKRRFTVSTVGLVPMISRFAREESQVNLAVSLHAVDDELRSSMLPINKKYPVDVLLDACRDYTHQTGRRVTFEWALIDGVNDDADQALGLADKLKGILCHVNIIPLNPTRRYAGRPTTRRRAQAFQEILTGRGISCSIRVRRGIDIQAGCGQLATDSLIQEEDL